MNNDENTEPRRVSFIKVSILLSDKFLKLEVEYELHYRTLLNTKGKKNTITYFHWITKFPKYKRTKIIEIYTTI